MTLDAIYLARHGQTEWNVEGRRQGRLDSPLTALGVLQARRNADLLLGERVDALYCSPIGRARRTAEILGETLGLPVQVLDDLAEVAHGAWSGLTSAEIDAGWPGQRAARSLDKYSFRFPDGESYADADARAGRALTQVVGARPLLVSHEMIGRMLLKQLGVPDALNLGQPSDVVFRVRGAQVVGRLRWAE